MLIVLCTRACEIVCLRPLLALFLKNRRKKISDVLLLKVVLPIVAQQHLWLIDKDLQRTVEPGEFQIWVGPSSDNLPLTATFQVQPESDDATITGVDVIIH